MATERDAEGQPPGPGFREAGCAPVGAGRRARRRAGDAAGPPAVIDAAWLRELCVAAGADDAAAVAWTTPAWPTSASTYSPHCPAPVP